MRNLIATKKLKQFKALTDIYPRPIIEIDLTGNVLEWNTYAKKLFPDLKKRGAKHPYLSGLSKITKPLLHTKRPIGRDIQIQEKWYKQRFYYLPKFNVIHIYGSDATTRIKTEQVLREIEKRYHDLFEKMNYGYALHDIVFNKKKRPVDYRFVDVNPAFEKLTHLKKRHIIGKTASQLAQTPQNKENFKMRKEYDKVALTGKPMYFETYNEKLKRYFELYAYQPNHKQVALIFSDITARKKTDEEKNNFIAIMSHELRNPLTPILANAQFIKSILPEHNVATSTIRESIDVIEKEAKTMASLLNDILDVSRLSRQKIQLKKIRVNICDVIKSSVETSMPFINTKNQDIKVFFGQNPLHISADPLRLEQIMVNIINNASKYTPPKGAIHIHCVVKNGQVEITVKDSGQGMDKDKIKRIFDLFNDDSQPFMGIGGLGIGLNIVKNLVTMHKGSIMVKSAGKDKGSKFTITLPLDKEALAAPKKTITTKLMEKKSSRILVVDDNKDIRQSLSQLLASKGHKIQMAHDGFDAIKTSRTFKPHTALIDIGLPGMSGHELAKKIRQEGNKKIRLIAVTGFGQEKDVAQAKASGFDHHLVKPVDIDELLRLIS